MLPTYLQDKPKTNALLYLSVCLIVLLVLPSAYAADQTPTVPGANPITQLSAQSMLVNIAEQIPSLMRMITAIAYVTGLYFIIQGIVMLKHAGEMRTQMSHEHHLTKPLVYLTIGAALTYFPTVVQIGMSTFWSNPNPYGYLSQQSSWYEFINVCFLIIQFIGALSFIRGLVKLSHLGGQGGQGMGSGITHIIGGILCINMYQFVQVIMITLGMQPL